MVWGGPFFGVESPLQLLLFGGKGGTGKTTCATATAFHLAQEALGHDKKLLLVSTDPAHSLFDSLAGRSPLPNLEILEFNARQSLERFKQKHAASLQEIAARGTFLDNDDVKQFLELSLPGLDELMAFIEISKWVQEQKYKCIVVDTAPTGHTLRLLAMPALIRRWLDALDALLAKHRYMRRLYSGSYQHDELDRFLLNLSEAVSNMQAVLEDRNRCRFIPVMLAEALSLEETAMLRDKLKRLRLPVTDIVINRLYPVDGCPVCLAARTRQQKVINHLLTDRAWSAYKFWALPQHADEIRGQELLDGFLNDIKPLSELPVLEKATVDVGYAVEAPFTLPALSKKLLVFAGKGGVGKTTMACATAVHLAEAQCRPGEILLFSSDPAHSLSACLQMRIGPQPTRIMAGLTAMEIDAEVEFEGLRHDYREELEDILNRFTDNLDFSFDREAMERLLDLAPPGLDEIMALTRVMQYLRNGQFDLLILDAAPTGHLIRLLEMPELIEQWLIAFFNLFLKYRQIFQLPVISRRLITISKDLKLLRATLADSDKSALIAVSILTEMAFAETHDLLDVCAAMKIKVDRLILNQATPAVECRLCKKLAAQKAGITAAFLSTFADIPQTLVYRQGEPRGVKELARLGAALCAPAGGRLNLRAYLNAGDRTYAKNGVL